jgi:predicted metal-dependent hydrolase
LLGAFLFALHSYGHARTWYPASGRRWRISKTVEIAGVGPVLFERSKKARRVIISVSPLTGVRVAVPYGLSVRKAEEFAYTQAAWIERQLARVRDYQERNRTVSDALKGIDKAEARRSLTSRLGHLAARHGFTYGRVSIRNQRTRWGSCSSTNNISLNMGVVGLPQELMDYVILHELAHTRIKNHNSDFWRLMDTLVGNGKALAASLREYRIGCL